MMRFLSLLFTLIIAASPALAAREDMGRYSLEPPEGWSVNQEGYIEYFTSPDEALTIYIVTQQFSGDAFKELLDTWIDEDTRYRIIEEGRSYIFSEGEGQQERGWLMLAEENVYFMLSIDGGYFEGLPAFVESLRAAPDQPGLEVIFKVLSASPEALDWLLFKTPDLSPETMKPHN